MADNRGPNQPITITLERWRWDQVLQCLDRYAAILRGDIERANQLDTLTDEFRRLVNAEGGQSISSPQVAESLERYEATLSQPTEPKRGKPWTAEENAAIIDAYFWMLDEQDAFRDFNKRAKYRELMAGPLHLRSRQSIEYKMRNISAVFQRHGLEWVEGLAPLSNTQADLGIAVEERLIERGMIERRNR